MGSSKVSRDQQAPGSNVREVVREASTVNSHQVAQKASRTLGLLRRTLSPCSQQVKSRAYTALVRPQIEYVSEVWNPSTVTDINHLEQVQKRAARFVFTDNSCYTAC